MSPQPKMVGSSAPMAAPPPQQKFSSKDDAISAGVRLALAGGYLLVSHSDGTVEKVFPFCRQ